MNDKPIAAGKSSYDLIDRESFIAALKPELGTIILDMACGVGKYAIALSGLVGDSGRIFAFDLWEEGIKALEREIETAGIKNITAGVFDIGEKLPIESASIDICLMATVLHDLVQDKTDDGALREAVRLLKPQGTLAVVEFRKIDGPPGPPRSIRLSPDELERLVSPYGFRLSGSTGVGEFNYMSLFRLNRS